MDEEKDIFDELKSPLNTTGVSHYMPQLQAILIPMLNHAVDKNTGLHIIRDVSLSVTTWSPKNLDVSASVWHAAEWLPKHPIVMLSKSVKSGSAIDVFPLQGDSELAYATDIASLKQGILDIAHDIYLGEN